MKPNFSSLLWGVILIISGGFALANNFGYLQGFSVTSWMLIFAIFSALFMASYFFNGLQAWGWLFPTCIFAALSGTLLITSLHIASELIPTLVVGSVAFPFMVAFLLDRSRTWALIPAFILGFIALIPPLDQVLGGDVMGAVVVAMLGLPFIAVYLASPKAWWGLIPGGILLSIGMMIALQGAMKSEIAVALMFAGWALTFGLVWRQRSQHATDWAKYPAIVMGILACIMLLIGMGLKTYWSIGLIAAGLTLVVLSLRPHKAVVLE